MKGQSRPLVKVASARNQAEAEFIQALLREEGVPSMTRRSAGFDVPDFLAAGPRDVMVPASDRGTSPGGSKGRGQDHAQSPSPIGRVRFHPD